MFLAFWQVWHPSSLNGIAGQARNDNTFLAPALMMGLEMCWSYSNKNRLSLNVTVGQARDNGRGWYEILCLSNKK